MTDKQIIIDGVDVSGCNFLTKEDEKSLLNVIDDLQKEKNKWVEKYNDLGQDFDQLKHKEQECNKYKQALDEIKPILEFYANSKMGEEQPDKTYHIMMNGGYIMIYDPKPARQALQKYFDDEGYHNLLDIINKAKKGK